MGQAGLFPLGQLGCFPGEPGSAELQLQLMSVRYYTAES